MTPIELTIFGIVCTTIGAVIGYFVDNKLAISRDKRKEFNALVDPVYRGLLVIRKQPSYHLTGNWEITFMLVRDKLPFWRKRGFDSAVEYYKKSKGSDNRERDGMGGFTYKDTKMIVDAANDLLKYLKAR